MSTFRMALMDWGKFFLTLVTVLMIPIVFFGGFALLVNLTANAFLSMAIYGLLMVAVTFMFDLWDHKYHLKRWQDF